MTQEEKTKICKRLHLVEKIQDILDRMCLGMAIFCMVMNLLSGNWICALIWFNCILWNWRAIRDTNHAKDLELKNAIMGYLIYEKYAKAQEPAANKEVIDVESKEVSPESEEKNS